MLLLGTLWSLDQDQSFVPYGGGQCAPVWFCPFPALPSPKENQVLPGESLQPTATVCPGSRQSVG